MKQLEEKSDAWRTWFKDKTDENKTRWKILAKAAKKMIGFKQKQTQRDFTNNMEINLKEIKMLFYHMMKNKIKPREGINAIMDQIIVVVFGFYDTF